MPQRTWTTTHEKLLEKMVDANASVGLSNKFLFYCRIGLAQDTCGRYERDATSRGAAQGYGGCASCHFRSAANDATRTAEIFFVPANE